MIENEILKPHMLHIIAYVHLKTGEKIIVMNEKIGPFLTTEEDAKLNSYSEDYYEPAKCGFLCTDICKREIVFYVFQSDNNFISRKVKIKKKEFDYIHVNILVERSW